MCVCVCLWVGGYIYVYMCVCIYMMEYHSATERNELMVFAVTWMRLETGDSK